MSDAWDDGARMVPRTETPDWKKNLRAKLERCHYEATAEWVGKGRNSQVITTLPRIMDAVDLGVLDRDTAVKFVREHFGWVDAHLVRHGRPMTVPSNPNEVRKWWRKLPRHLMTEAEIRLADAACNRLRAECPEGFETASNQSSQGKRVA